MESAIHESGTQLTEVTHVSVKPEPLSPEHPSTTNPPATFSTTNPPPTFSTTNPPPTNHAPGRFSSSRLANSSDKLVNLSDYSYGLYSYYAEGNNNHEFDAPHFDPYFGAADIKDPELLARAKRYFENLRQERCEEAVEDYEVRSARVPGGPHQPMYQRKRKKVQRLVVLVNKIPISSFLRTFLQTRYPPPDPPAKRCHHASDHSSSQEDKLHEFLGQFKPGSTQPRSRPYSHRCPTSRGSTPTFSRGNTPSASTSLEHSRSNTPSCSGNLEPFLSDRHNPSLSTSRTPSPMTPMSQSNPSFTPEPYTQQSADPLSQFHSVIKPEPIEPTIPVIKPEPMDHDVSTGYINHHPMMAVKMETMSMSCEHFSVIKPDPDSIPDPVPSVNSENIAPNIPQCEDPLPAGTEKETVSSDKKKKKKKRKKVIPFSVKVEPGDEQAIEPTGTALSITPDQFREPTGTVLSVTPDQVMEPTGTALSVTPDQVIEPSGTVPDQAAHPDSEHSGKIRVKEEPVEDDQVLQPSFPEPSPHEPSPPEVEEPPVDKTMPSLETSAAIPDPLPALLDEETIPSSPKTGSDGKIPVSTPCIKEEPLDAEQLRMVEIFRKRVKKLKKIEVTPMAPIKDEPVDFEEVLPDTESLIGPEIKQEPDEATLLFFEPKPPPKKKTMFVYGRRIQGGRARISASQPRGRLETVEAESEFDQAAKMRTPFSPPKSSWSNITDNQKRAEKLVMERAEEEKKELTRQVREREEEECGLTVQIDRLIEAGNIQTIDDTEKLYTIFASTIRSTQDPAANVFNLVLERFKENKAMEESLKVDFIEPSESIAKEEAPKEEKQTLLFPMSDQEIYNQGLAVIGETKAPGEFELTQVKVEVEEAPFVPDAAPFVEVYPSEAECTTQPTVLDNPLESVSETVSLQQPASVEDEQHAVLDTISPPHSPTPDLLPPSSLPLPPVPSETLLHDDASPIKIKNSVERYKPNILKSGYRPGDCGMLEGRRDEVRVTDELSPPPLSTSVTRLVVGQSSSILPHPPFKAEQDRVKSKSEMTEAERLFDEMLVEEQGTFPAPETSYMEPFARADTLFASTSLDDFIKAPLSSNEHLVKPKPSYVRMSYHDASEIGENSRPSQSGPGVVLFSSKPEDMVPRENAEWNHWRRHHESYDQFHSGSSWTIDEQSSSWSPQHSLYDSSYFEHPTSSSSTSFEEAQREGWGRSQGNYPIIERTHTGQEIIKIPVEQRNVATQFPNKQCLAVEEAAPVINYIVQRQENVSDRGMQTESSFLEYGHYNPFCSVLVEPLLSARKAVRPPPCAYQQEPGRLVEQRTVQTQYPANNTRYTAIDPSLPFMAYSFAMQTPVTSSSQTDGEPIANAGGTQHRHKRRRPVLVEPVPNIVPIGENVRTMRSSDAYGILMEQIRTSTDPKFDRFMNSQLQPNGVLSRFNKYACYAPQGGSPDLPLTVKKSFPGEVRKTGHSCKGKRPGIEYKEVLPQQIPSEHCNKGLTAYQMSVKIRRMGQVENIIGRLSNAKIPKKRRPSLSPKR